MTLKEMIYHRKSCRGFAGEPVDDEMREKILSFAPKPLSPETRLHINQNPRIHRGEQDGS